MAGRQPAPLQAGEGSSSRLTENSFLDHFLRRQLEGSDGQLEIISAAATTAATLPSPSNSIAALVSNYDDLSPNAGANINPWQYLSTSDPSSPTSQREYYNQLTHNSSQLFPSSHFQRDLVAEYPWMQEVLEQQRAANSSHNQINIEDHSRSNPGRSNDHVDWQKLSSRGPAAASNSIRRRREQVIVDPPAGTSSNSSAQPDELLQNEALNLYEEAAWYRNGGYLRPDFMAGGELGLSENFARLDSSGTTQSSDSGVPNSGVPNSGVSNSVEVTRSELARMRWERMENMASREFAESSADASGAVLLPRPSRDAGAPSGSTQSANDLPETSSEIDGDDVDSDDEEECTRSIDPPGSMSTGDGDCNGKRKTPEVSGEDGDDSARISSEAEHKRTSSSGPRKRSTSNADAKLPREPRYAIKTRTDVDIMDDGFKWRKYGQKAVKNSPHPRNYYRCTTPHCPVRKRVERSHEDPGLVITTYEGRHTHLTPGFQRPGANSTSSPAGLYFGDHQRPRAAHGSQSPTARQLPPLPHEFSTLAALHQMRALRTLQQTLAQHQMAGSLNPGSLQRDSQLLRAQHFLGLQDLAAFGSTSSFGVPSVVKQEPTFNPFDFMTSRMSSHGGLPYPGRPSFPPPAYFLERMQQLMQLPQQMMRPAAARGAQATTPRHQLRPTSSQQSDDIDVDFPDGDDLVRRVLEAELEQDHQFRSAGAAADGPGNSNIDHDINIANSDSSTFNSGGAAAVSPQNFASQIQSSLRSRVELIERQRSALQRPPGAPPRANNSLRRSKAAGGSSDNLVAAGSTSSTQRRQQSPREPEHPLDGLLQEMVDQPGDR